MTEVFNIFYFVDRFGVTFLITVLCFSFACLSLLFLLLRAIPRDVSLFVAMEATPFFTLFVGVFRRGSSSGPSPGSFVPAKGTGSVGSGVHGVRV